MRCVSGTKKASQAKGNMRDGAVPPEALAAAGQDFGGGLWAQGGAPGPVGIPNMTINSAFAPAAVPPGTRPPTLGPPRGF